MKNLIRNPFIYLSLKALKNSTHTSKFIAYSTSQLKHLKKHFSMFIHPPQSDIEQVNFSQISKEIICLQEHELNFYKNEHQNA